MYNADIKQQFVKYMCYGNNSKALKMEERLNNLEEVEIKLQKDFACFSFGELIENLPFILVKTVDYQKQQLSLLRKYLDWCIENGHSNTGENFLIGFSPSDIDFSEPYQAIMVKDEKQLEDYLNIVLPDVKEESKNNMYRTMLHLIFNGIELNDVFNLKENQINFQNNTLSYKSREVKLSKICIDLIKNGMNMSYISTADGKLRNITKRGYILENSSDTRNSMKITAQKVASNTFASLTKELNNTSSITITSLWRSGVFYRAYENEQKTGNIDLSEIKHTSSVLLEYNTWKKAFDLK